MSPKSRNVRLTLLCIAVAGGLVAAAAGCQTYDFEPVQPLAVAQQTTVQTITNHLAKPDLYLLVDRSGSMRAPTDPSDPDCRQPDGGTCGLRADGVTMGDACDTSVCPTRWSDMQSAMHTFLSGSGTVARMGLSFFPIDQVCGPSQSVDVAVNTSADDTASMQQTADAIDSAIATKTPGGGTPSNASLTFAGGALAATAGEDRNQFVLLLTDGLPNCNPNLDPSTCTCTASNCAGDLNGNRCLDDNGTVNEITQLQANNGIKTIVVGFGSDTTTGDAQTVLSAMANAGGFPKSCPNGTDAECGTGDTCNTATKVCNKPYYSATNGEELAAALAAISKKIVVGVPCEWDLGEAPSDPTLLSVLIDGTETPPGADTWKYDAAYAQENNGGQVGPTILFQGALCQKIEDSTPSNPVNIQVQVVKSL